MRAVVLQEYGGPEVLQIQEVPDLTPGAGQVRVRVHATALNRADVLQRMGRYPQPGPKPEYEIPGLEFAGVIDALGPGVTGWQKGDRVCGLLPGGGYAEQVVTHERLLIPIPSSLSFAEAAAVPEVFMTAYDALLQAELGLGQVALIHAGGSGVGTAALQLARAMGARVFVTVGSEEKARRAEELGADRTILYRQESFSEVVRQETDGHGADVILDFIGKPYLKPNLEAAAVGARLVQIGTMGGAQAEIPLGLLMSRRAHLIGTVLRARPLEQKMALTQRLIQEVMPLVAAGQIRPVVDRVFPLADVAAAHIYMEENRNFGKVVLAVNKELG